MTQATPDRRLGRVPALDGLRTIAVVLTSLVHLLPDQVPGGIFGVDVFFVLSGFLITSILLDGFARHGRVDLRSFYIRRAQRLLPAVLAVLVVFTLVVLLASPSRRELEVAGVVDVTVITYIFNWSDIFGHHPPWQVDHLWSLSVEEQFYIFWPLALVLLLRTVTRRTIMILTAATALMSSIAQGLVFALTHSTAWAYQSSPLHAQGILVGCLLAQIFIWRRSERATTWLSTHNWPAAVGLAVVVILSLTTGVDDLFTYVGGMAIAVLASAVLVATLVANATLSTPDWLTRALSVRWMVALGRRSYSIYLWENFMAWALTGSLRHSVLWIPANVVATLVAAEISFRFVERRFMHRPVPQPSPATSVASGPSPAATSVAPVGAPGAAPVAPAATEAGTESRSTPDSAVPSRRIPTGPDL